MTSDEIRERINKFDYETSHREDGLWEIAYQLAVMNERERPIIPEHWRKFFADVQTAMDKREPPPSFKDFKANPDSLSSPVGADSDTISRTAEEWQDLALRVTLFLRRTADERTMRPDPQSTPIQS